jgi:DnaJ-domain-containing protein 1
MTNKSKNENHYKAANQVIRKLEFLSHVDSDIADAHDHGNKQAEMTLYTQSY